VARRPRLDPSQQYLVLRQQPPRRDVTLPGARSPSGRPQYSEVIGEPVVTPRPLIAARQVAAVIGVGELHVACARRVASPGGRSGSRLATPCGTIGDLAVAGLIFLSPRSRGLIPVDANCLRGQDEKWPARRAREPKG
jgi:hypothetical protein